MCESGPCPDERGLTVSQANVAFPIPVSNNADTEDAKLD